MRESDLVTAIQNRVREMRQQGHKIYCVKLHGSRFSRAGTPDLHVTYNGRSVWVECKIPGEEPTPLQWQELRNWGAAGAVVGWCDSLAGFEQIIAQAA